MTAAETADTLRREGCHPLAAVAERSGVSRDTIERLLDLDPAVSIRTGPGEPPDVVGAAGALLQHLIGPR